MFPYCRYRLSGLDPERQYSLVLSIVPFDKHKYRWNKPNGRLEDEESMSPMGWLQGGREQPRLHRVIAGVQPAVKKVTEPIVIEENEAERRLSISVVHSPSLTVALQPELDDVEGLLFISFTSKFPQCLKSSQHKRGGDIRDCSGKDFTPRGDLLQDLRVLRHRQVIHPVLQEVGLKLSSIDLTKSIDLHYLGVSLPLPPITQPERCDATLCLLPIRDYPSSPGQQDK
ncbi:hypothetical protein INR49_027195 [Caranx melampygus]|nr:hypothetical protein INR49_027195 [Caranx melampygus]